MLIIVMFYATLFLLGVIIMSGAGYIIHYYVKNKDSPKRDDEREWQKRK
ncbi:MAG: hypothetical protein ACOWWO_01395 [Peptococcaceae bacterium]